MGLLKTDGGSHADKEREIMSLNDLIRITKRLKHFALDGELDIKTFSEADEYIYNWIKESEWRIDKYNTSKEETIFDKLLQEAQDSLQGFCAVCIEKIFSYKAQRYEFQVSRLETSWATLILVEIESLAKKLEAYIKENEIMPFPNRRALLKKALDLFLPYADFSLIKERGAV